MTPTEEGIPRTEHDRGLTYWLDWINQFKVWMFAKPEHIFTEARYHIKDVGYHDLEELRAHFVQRKVYEENAEHRRWLMIDVVHGMSITEFVFESPRRKVRYKPFNLSKIKSHE